MRFYPTADICHYWEFPSGWTHYCHNPLKSWHRRPLQGKHTIAYWPDIEGGKMSLITQKDLHFKDWPSDRIRPEACLPWYYCVGHRFIRLERASPAGFKCAALPLSLQEVRELKDIKRQLVKRKRKEARNA